MEMTEETIIGPMGSEFRRISGLTPDGVLDRVRDMDRKGIGRRIMADAIRGIVTWMSPSSSHEVLGVAADDVIRISCELLGIQNRSMRGTRWRLPDGRPQTGLEADAAFYIGESARAWISVWKKGRRAVEEFEARTPPDLVVEVEITHFDRGKARRYRDLGVRELWQVARKDDDMPNAAVTDLQAEGHPRELNGSRVLSGLDRDSLARSLHLAEGQQNDELRTLLDLLFTSMESSGGD